MPVEPSEQFLPQNQMILKYQVLMDRYMEQSSVLFL